MLLPSLLIYHTLTPVVRYAKPGFFLFGHGVTDKKMLNPIIQDLHMQLRHFSAMIDLWKGMGFVFLSMEEALEVVLHGRIMEKPWIHLTFDDGYRNNFTVLYPFLKARNIPFTVFLSTRNIMEQRRFDNYYIYTALLHTNDEHRRAELFEAYKFLSIHHLPYHLQGREMVRVYKYFSVPAKLKFLDGVKRLMTAKEWEAIDRVYDTEEVLRPEEIKTMAGDPLVTFGSHGHNHYILSTLDDDAINFEQRESKRLMKQLTGNEPRTYCYPNGKPEDMPPHIGILTAGNHYTVGFTTVKRKIEGVVNPYAVPRFPLSYRYMPKLFLKVL